MDENRNDPTTGRSTRNESARDLLEQSMYHLVRLTRLGVQAAASGIERLEESMARRRQRGTEPKQKGEAPFEARPSGTSTPEAKGADLGEAGDRHQPGSQHSGESRH